MSVALALAVLLPINGQAPLAPKSAHAAAPAWLDRMNMWRAIAKVPAVTENTTWSAGDYNHARYMVKNDIVTHYETAGTPYYTVAGDTAARNSNLNVNSTTSQTDVQAIDWWMQAPIHAMGIVDPRLTSTGFGSYREAGPGWEFGAALDWTMTSDAYYNRKMTAGGVFFDMGAHMVDRVMWLFGEVADISFEDDSYGGMESNSILRGTLTINSRPVPCRMQFSWTHALDNVLRVVGSEATAELPISKPNVLVFKRAGMKFVSTTDAADPFRLQLEDFLAAVRTRRQPFVDALSTVAGLALIEKAYAVRTRMAQPWVEA